MIIKFRLFEEVYDRDDNPDERLPKDYDYVILDHHYYSADPKIGRILPHILPTIPETIVGSRRIEFEDGSINYYNIYKIKVWSENKDELLDIIREIKRDRLMRKFNI